MAIEALKQAIATSDWEQAEKLYDETDGVPRGIGDFLELDDDAQDAYLEWQGRDFLYEHLESAGISALLGYFAGGTAEYVWQLVDDGVISIDEHLQPYFDAATYARDMECSGDVACIDGYVFDCHA